MIVLVRRRCLFFRWGERDSCEERGRASTRRALRLSLTRPLSFSRAAANLSSPLLSSPDPLLALIDLSDTSLSTLPTFCPRLERLTLNLCGRLDDDVLKEWGKGFKQLKYLSLYGKSFLPFRLRWRAEQRREAAPRKKKRKDES